MQQLETRIVEGLDAERRLAELRLNLSGMREVVLRGEYARAEATAHDPVTAAATDAYRYRVRALRDLYCGNGWRKEYDTGLELICSEDDARVVLTRGGDENVGFRDAFPQPSRDLGEAAESAVNAQPALDTNWFNKPTSGKPRREVWMLLVHRAGDVVRAELSLASDVEDGQVSGWIERIILPFIDFNDLEPVGHGPVEVPSVPGTIDVPVVRKK